MKRSSFNEEQILAILKEQEAGMATAEVCHRHGISSATFYKWKSNFGGPDDGALRQRLRARRRGGRKLALGTRRPMVLPDGPNQRWPLDFVSESLICGRRFRILCAVDDYTRECLALVADA